MGVSNLGQPLSSELSRLRLAQRLIGRAAIGSAVLLIGCAPKSPTTDGRSAGHSTTEGERRPGRDFPPPAQDLPPVREWAEAWTWGVSEEGEGAFEVLSPATVERLESLPATPKLTRFVFRGGGIDAAGLRSLGERFRVEQLTVGASGWTKREWQAVAQLKQLRRLNVEGVAGEELELAFLAELVDLESLRIELIGSAPDVEHRSDASSEVGPATVDLSPLDASSRLRHLHLLGFDIDASGAAAIERLDRLESLYLDRCRCPEGWLVSVAARHPDWHLHVDGGHLDGSR
ncbi:MAG TPA: hypothetical protein PLI18_05130 [Pirellulaceae bacterium]|nr:hypothetical protein [Pirellulaceae bacterium]